MSICSRCWSIVNVALELISASTALCFFAASWRRLFREVWAVDVFAMLLARETRASKIILVRVGKLWETKDASFAEVRVSCVSLREGVMVLPSLMVGFVSQGPAGAIRPTAESISRGNWWAHARANGPPPEPPRMAKRGMFKWAERARTSDGQSIMRRGLKVEGVELGGRKEERP